jgi:uncharacterized protein YxjI
MERPFSFVDRHGNFLRFERFRYQFDADAVLDLDRNWLCCRTTIHIATERSEPDKLSFSVETFFLTRELTRLADALRDTIVKTIE